MMESVGSAIGLGETKNPQTYIYTNPGASIGFGPRSDPMTYMPHWTPAAGEYRVEKDGTQNDAPKFKFGTAPRNPLKQAHYTQSCNYKVKNTFVDGHGDGARYTMARKHDYKGDQEFPGPGTYMIKGNQTAPAFQMGSRFDSDVRSKDHIRPRKKDGPGPGSYVMPSSIKVAKKENKNTFGKSNRDWSDLPKNTPAPNHYNPAKFTEASHQYSFPKGQNVEKLQLAKARFAPGPGNYDLRKEDKMEGMAKSMLGGSKDPKQITDNGVPGPGQYSVKLMDSIPGFKIVPHQERDSNDFDDKNPNNMPVGPQKYDPNYFYALPNKAAKIGTMSRDQMGANFHTPAPNTYTLPGDFDKKPQFHMGIRTGGRGNKNLDQPGPGEYETDVVPLHHSNIQHVIGTGFRGDLGVGKSHLYPGPGEYEVRGQIEQEGSKIGFGTQMKVTRIKKTFEPGPGSYDLPTTVGHIPKYLLLGNTVNEMKKTGSPERE